MKRLPYLLSLLMLAAPAWAVGPPGHIVSAGHPVRAARAAYLPEIADMTGQVSTDSLNNDILWLTEFYTRRADTPNARQAAAWIEAKFRSFGLDSVGTHEWSITYAPNVFAVLPGIVSPESIFVIGGHYDSISRTTESAPGADDNASGTAGVLECARILSRYHFAKTLEFVTFSAEEFGLFGSNAFAERARRNHEKIIGMLNLDMIGYRDPSSPADLDLIAQLIPSPLRDLAIQTTATYVPDLPVVRGWLPDGAGSDHLSFWSHGFDAIFFFEDSHLYSPFIHTPQDLILDSYNDPALATAFTKASVALLATIAEPLEVAVEVADFQARAGADRVELSWRLSDEAQRQLDGIQVERADRRDGPYEPRAGSGVGDGRARHGDPSSPGGNAAPSADRGLGAPAVLLPGPSMSFEDREVDAGRTYWYRLVLLTSAGTAELVGPIEVAVGDAVSRLALYTPFVPSDGGPVQIRYVLGRTQAALRLGIYDVRGRLLRSFRTPAHQPGEHLQTWDRRDDDGLHVHRGVYFVRLEAGGTRAARKLVLARE